MGPCLRGDDEKRSNHADLPIKDRHNDFFSNTASYPWTSKRRPALAFVATRNDPGRSTMDLILRYLICLLLGLIIICVPTAYELVSEDHASHGAAECGGDDRRLARRLCHLEMDRAGVNLAFRPCPRAPPPPCGRPRREQAAPLWRPAPGFPFLAEATERLAQAFKLTELVNGSTGAGWR